MMKHPLLLPRKYLLSIAILGLLIILLGAIFRITHWDFFGVSGRVFIVVGTVISFFPWIIVMIDVIKNRMQNWILWIFCLFLFGNIATIIYLLNRKP